MDGRVCRDTTAGLMGGVRCGVQRCKVDAMSYPDDHTVVQWVGWLVEEPHIIILLQTDIEGERSGIKDGVMHACRHTLQRVQLAAGFSSMHVSIVAAHACESSGHEKARLGLVVRMGVLSVASAVLVCAPNHPSCRHCSEGFAAGQAWSTVECSECEWTGMHMDM